jgi:hypothetical protein
MYTYIAVEIDPMASNQHPAFAYRTTLRKALGLSDGASQRWAIVFCLWGICLHDLRSDRILPLLASRNSVHTNAECSGYDATH